MQLQPNHYTVSVQIVSKTKKVAVDNGDSLNNRNGVTFWLRNSLTHIEVGIKEFGLKNAKYFNILDIYIC